MLPNQPVKGRYGTEVEQQQSKLKLKWGVHTFNQHITRFETLSELRFMNAIAGKAAFTVAVQLLNRVMLKRLDGPRNSKEKRWTATDLKVASRIPMTGGSYSPEHILRVTEAELIKHKLVRGIDDVLEPESDLSQKASSKTRASTKRMAQAAAGYSKVKSSRTTETIAHLADGLSGPNSLKLLKAESKQEAQSAIKLESSAVAGDSLADPQHGTHSFIDEQTRALAAENEAIKERLKRDKARMKAFQSQKAENEKLKAAEKELKKLLAGPIL